MSAEIDEVTRTLDSLRRELEDLAVGGLRAIGPERAPALEALGGEFERIGATHFAERLGSLVAGIRADSRDAAGALLRAQSSLRLFERILTLRTVEARLAALADLDEDPGESA